MTEADIGMFLGMLVIWFICSIGGYLWRRDTDGEDIQWDKLSYANLFKIIRKIWLVVTAPFRALVSLIEKRWDYNHMSPVQREIYEREQAIRELEEQGRDIEKLKRIRKKEQQLEERIAREEDELNSYGIEEEIR